MRTQRGEMEQVDSTKHWPSVRSQAVLAGLLATMACSDSLSSGHNADRPQRWDLNVVVRIGDDNDPSVGLTRVTQVAFGPENNIFIAQSIDRQIRIYDLAGKMLHNIGRSGEGPGEFRSISAMGFVHDTLFVSDGSLRRVSMFEADGSFIQSFPWVSTATPETGSPVFHIPTVPQMVLEDGTALLQQGYGFMPGQAKHLATPWLRIGHDPRIRQDTIAVQEADLPDVGTLTEQGREFLFAPPLSDFPLYTLMADGSGIAIIERPAATDAGTHEFRLLRIDPVGDTVLTRAYSYDPTATPPGEVDRQVALLLERYSSSPQRPSREGVARIVEGPGFLPPYLPPVSSARSGQDGSIWIQREVVGPDSVAWNKIDTTGTRKGEIWLPLTAQIMAAQGDLVAVLELNELDVPYVVVYRVMY